MTYHITRLSTKEKENLEDRKYADSLFIFKHDIMKYTFTLITIFKVKGLLYLAKSLRCENGRQFTVGFLSSPSRRLNIKIITYINIYLYYIHVKIT